MKKILTLSGCLILLIAFAGLTPRAEAAVFMSGSNLKCLDLPNGIPKLGVELHMWDCHGRGNQQFQISQNGQISIGGLCVDAFGGRGNAGDKIGLWTCHGGANQRWVIEGNRLKGINGRCVDIARGDTNNGAKLVLWDCHGGANQYWIVTGTGSSQRLAWEKRFMNARGVPERCFGAIGNGCDGAPQAPTQRLSDGRIKAQIAVGSILHDNCCVRNPDGMMCGGASNNIVAGDQLAGMADHQACAKEWRKAVYNTLNNRSWVGYFGPYSNNDLSHSIGNDLRQTAGRTTKMADRSGNFIYTYKGGETVETQYLCAPSGTDLDQDDVQFCCSKRFKQTGYMWPAMVGAWGRCE
jgi:hypothetical protein